MFKGFGSKINQVFISNSLLENQQANFERSREPYFLIKNRVK